jgi:hypothetical protein
MYINFNMKKLIFLIAFTAMLGTPHSFAQDGRIQLQDPNTGKMYSPSKYSEIRGTPFLSDKWTSGLVITPKGKYVDLKLKLDAYSNILYLNKDDELYEFADVIRSFVLMPNISDSNSYMYFLKGLSGSDIRKDQYVQVLSDGSFALYKVPMIFVSEVNEINNGVVKTFRKVDKYYVLVDNILQPMRLTKNDLLGQFANKSAKVEAYATTNNLSYKKESDVIKLFHYYNSIK